MAEGGKGDDSDRRPRVHRAKVDGSTTSLKGQLREQSHELINQRPITKKQKTKTKLTITAKCCRKRDPQCHRVGGCGYQGGATETSRRSCCWCCQPRTATACRSPASQTLRCQARRRGCPSGRCEDPRRCVRSRVDDGESRGMDC